MPSIEEAIQQANFEDPLHRVQVNILFTSNWLNHHNTILLRPYGLSLQQFNILRILRGRSGKPATVKLLTERMLDKMSNASRLVDKLKEKGLVDRQECATDRRRVDILITDKGLDVLADASAAVTDNSKNLGKNLTDEEANQLSGLLDRLRGRRVD